MSDQKPIWRRCGGYVILPKQRGEICPCPIADLGLDNELEEYPRSTFTLSQVLVSRKNIFVAEIGELGGKLETDLS